MGKLYHDPRQVIVCSGGRTYLFCSLTLVMQTFGIKSTSQAVRLIENGQNIPNTNVTIDWALDDAPKVRFYEDVTEDMMSQKHIQRMEAGGVHLVDQLHKP